MKRGALTGLAIIAGLASAVRYFPLSWAAGLFVDAPVSYSGTIWNGQVNNVPLVGDISVKSSLSGASLTSAPGDVTFSGDISPSDVRDMVLSMPVSRLPITDTRLTGLSGRVSLRIEEARVKSGQCEVASGTASTNVLSANRTQFDWAGPDLSGPVDCVDGRLRVQLSGEDQAQSVQAVILTGLDGVYKADITVTTLDPVAGNVLAVFGFTPGAAGNYTLSEQGRWR